MVPQISIIIPIYNVEKYIKRCIDSVINQTFRNIEIILVDDKSPDNCPQICDEYVQKDHRIRVIHKPKNEGLGMARNSGIQIAQGRYIAFIDSDDFIDYSMYQNLYNLAIQDNYDVVYSEFNTSFYPGFTIIKKKEQIYKNKNEIETLMIDMIGSEPSYPSDVKFQVSSCKALYSLEIIKKYQIQFHSERNYISEDLLFNLEFLSKANKAKYTPQKWYYYCLNNSSLSHSYKQQVWNKYLKIYLYLKSKESFFNNKKEFNLRLQRTLIFYTRGALTKEILLNPNKKESSINIRNILECKELKEVLGTYPGYLLPIKHKIFFYLIKFRIKPFISLLLRNHKK